jgi:predicted ATP-dependent protease
MILTGYITDTYLRQQPVSLAARLVFEQSYSEVEGDSASSAELYALLSALSGVPVRQGIAVTGSVNQKGEVQAIGGVNEKVEGFFEICKKAGLNGQQGVIIPASNRKHLLLKEEVIEAVKSEKFSIWTVDHIDEGIELLTGVPGGPADKVGTIAYKVQEALNEYADRAREYLKTENGKKKSGKRK